MAPETPPTQETPPSPLEDSAALDDVESTPPPPVEAGEDPAADAAAEEVRDRLSSGSDTTSGAVESVVHQELEKKSHHGHGDHDGHHGPIPGISHFFGIIVWLWKLGMKGAASLPNMGSGGGHSAPKKAASGGGDHGHH